MTTGGGAGSASLRLQRVDDPDCLRLRASGVWRLPEGRQHIDRIAAAMKAIGH